MTEYTIEHTGIVQTVDSSLGIKGTVPDISPADVATPRQVPLRPCAVQVRQPRQALPISGRKLVLVVGEPVLVTQLSADDLGVLVVKAVRTNRTPDVQVPYLYHTLVFL